MIEDHNEEEQRTHTLIYIHDRHTHKTCKRLKYRFSIQGSGCTCRSISCALYIRYKLYDFARLFARPAVKLKASVLRFAYVVRQSGRGVTRGEIFCLSPNTADSC